MVNSMEVFGGIVTFNPELDRLTENIKAILNAIEMQRNKDGDNVEIAEGDVKFSEEETVD